MGFEFTGIGGAPKIATTPMVFSSTAAAEKSPYQVPDAKNGTTKAPHWAASTCTRDVHTPRQPPVLSSAAQVSGDGVRVHRYRWCPKDRHHADGVLVDGGANIVREEAAKYGATTESSLFNESAKRDYDVQGNGYEFRLLQIKFATLNITGDCFLLQKVLDLPAGQLPPEPPIWPTTSTPH